MSKSLIISLFITILACLVTSQNVDDNVCEPTTTTSQPTTITTTTEAPLPCEPRGYLVGGKGSFCYDAGNNCYCVYKAENPRGWVWPQADWYCRNVSMALVSIESEEEENLLAGIAENGEFWVGAERSSPNLPWTWSSTGESFTYDNWVTPNEALKTGCVTFKAMSNIPARWFVKDCTRGEDTATFWFICETAAPKEPPTAAGCPADSYDADSYMTWQAGARLNQKLYCFSSYWSDWNTAKSLCENAGLNLLSLESATENDVIAEYVRTRGLDVGSGFWTSGYCNHDNGSSWYWASSGEEFSFENFESANEVCAAYSDDIKVWINVEKGGKWNVNPETRHRQIICEE